jgi:ribonucleoside-diphosphate reductase alpha chain
LFYERFIQDGEITLFSPHDVPGLYDSFGLDGFDDLYRNYESDEAIPKRVVKARELFLELTKERAETGRIYVMNIDHCNTHSSFTVPVRMSNLCQEITLPTKPLSTLTTRTVRSHCVFCLPSTWARCVVVCLNWRTSVTSLCVPWTS